MNELTLAAAVSPAAEIMPVADVVDELHLVAADPAAMQLAQRRLAAWCAQKIAILQGDVRRLGESIDVADRNGWKLAGLERQHRIARRRVEYFEKIRTAVEAGYCVVPNFPVDIFAIRTKRRRPRKGETTSRWESHRQSTEAPPLGEGAYVDSVPEVYQRSGPSDEVDRTTGLPKEITTYFAEEFQEIDFPISLARPEIMSATARAMALKCFDAIGVLPHRTTRTDDPLIVGRIHQAGSERHISFLLAWYIDTRQL